jgi:hypothetical protein
MIVTPEALGPEYACGDHARPLDAECENLAFEEAARVGPEVPEFIHFDSSFESEDTFDVRIGMAIALEQPIAEELIVEAGKRLQGWVQRCNDEAALTQWIRQAGLSQQGDQTHSSFSCTYPSPGPAGHPHFYLSVSCPHPHKHKEMRKHTCC